MLVPPGHPLTIAAIGAQFALQLQQLTPTPTPAQLHNQRLARMAEFRNAFLQLGFHISDDILGRLESVSYDMVVPQIIRVQFAARSDPLTRWKRAEDMWNEVSTPFRALVPDYGMLRGWDELEPLPLENQ